jgi:hypothetical protein
MFKGVQYYISGASVHLRQSLWAVKDWTLLDLTLCLCLAAFLSSGKI